MNTSTNRQTDTHRHVNRHGKTCAYICVNIHRHVCTHVCTHVCRHGHCQLMYAHEVRESARPQVVKVAVEQLDTRVEGSAIAIQRLWRRWNSAQLKALVKVAEAARACSKDV